MILRCLLSLLLACSTLQARSVTLAWDASEDPRVVAYKLHMGTAPGVYDVHIDVGNALQRTVLNLVDGTQYYFAVTALTGLAIESTPSDVLMYRAVESGPPGSIEVVRYATGRTTLLIDFRQTYDQIRVERSPDLQSWATLLQFRGGGGRMTIDDLLVEQQTQHFYRLVGQSP